MDSGLLPLGTDQEVIQLERYVPNHKEINLYFEHKNTRVFPYFKSLLKVRIEEVEGDHSPEMDRVRMKKKSIESCSKKLDFNEPTDLSKLIVPYEPVMSQQVNFWGSYTKLSLCNLQYHISKDPNYNLFKSILSYIVN